MNKRILLALILALSLSACGKQLKLASVSPAEIVSGEPTLIEIKGQGFKDGTKVWIGETECEKVTFAGPEKLVALPPSVLDAGTFEVRVQNPDQKGASLPAAIHVKSGLKVISLRPNYTIKDVTGVTVVIEGKGLREGDKVFFGEAESPKVEIKDDGFISAVVPVLPSGLHDVTVQGPGGGKASLYQAFQVLAEGSQAPFQRLIDKASDLGIMPHLTSKNGVAIADVNGDGIDDIGLFAADGIRLELGTGKGKFREASAEYGLGEIKGIYSGFFGDFDNDGFPDLLITSGNVPRLYHNEKGKKFVDVTKRVGINQDGAVYSAAWGDFNADGYLDLFLGYSNGPDRFLRNEGGHFTEEFNAVFNKYDRAREIGNTQPTTFSGSFADYDNDGWVDLFVGVRGQPSMLMRNLGGNTFKDMIDDSGINVSIPGSKNPVIYSLDWGVTWGDINNDGYLDLFLASGPAGLFLYRNNGGKTFDDITGGISASIGQSPLGASFGDFDNDGYQDIAVTDNLSGMIVLRNQGDGTFTDVSRQLGISRSTSGPMGISWMDVNMDGALDLVVTEYSKLDLVLVNSPYPGRHYLLVKLNGTKSNSEGIGAVVTVQAGATVLTRQVSGGESYLSQPSPTLHFGMGPSAKADKITVRWPGGETQEAFDVPADQLYIITQPGERKTAELPPPLSSSTVEQTTTPAPAAGSTHK